MPDVIAASATFVLGFIILVKGADFFVESAARVARILGVSELVIGLTLVAVGTSLPELVTGVVASYSGQTEIVLGNIVGSNIANIALILGSSALLAPLITGKEMFYRDGVVLMTSSVLFYYFASDGAISYLEGLVLLWFFLMYTTTLLLFKPRIEGFGEYVNYMYHLSRISELEKQFRMVLNLGVRVGVFPINILNGERRREYLSRLRAVREYGKQLQEMAIKDLGIIVVSLAAVYLGAEFFVRGAVDIAHILGVGPSIIGLTLVSVGTSMPEFVVSIQAARKGFNQMVIGNILGSNIANITLIGGVCAIIAPISLGVSAGLRDMNEHYIIPFMIVVSLLCIIFIRSRWTISRREGIVLLLLYAGFLAWLISTPAILTS
jgi:cation:H+ antiporter